ncbi:DUF4407 domain-containing protein [Chitinophaga sancti]|uniref:DUF4407 domain-containing protein n=1 Tax=Chitinophaga sancti TaxID=1004 RepID=UPI002A74B1DF|nr:DUF4407 domain-containing protein [Chitinophaga sancti]WPQ63297.1 DUF4407 domain-containing protein [Chitinophaga sancti]
MSKVLHMLRQFFCTFSGEDANIIKRCEWIIQLKFCGIGIFVLMIFCGCFASAASFIFELLEGGMKWVSIPVGIFWALLITNMYLFLLYTVSPTLLPITHKKKGHKKAVSTTSQKTALGFRMSFISLLAIIIVQPLNVIIFYHPMSPFAPAAMANLNKHTAAYKANMVIAADSILIIDEIQLQKLFSQHVSLNSKHLDDSITIANNTFLLNNKVTEDARFLNTAIKLIDTLNKYSHSFFFNSKSSMCDSIRTTLGELLEAEITSDNTSRIQIQSLVTNNEEVKKYQSQLLKDINQKTENYYQLNALLLKSNFYTKKIQLLLANNILPWLITFIGCGIFLLPVYWKFSIRNKGGFYEIKKEIENELVINQYKEFKILYTAIFSEKINTYNQHVWRNLIPLLDKLEKIRPKKYNELRKELEEILIPEVIEKYEYWSDAPFRTKRRTERPLASEEQLLKIIYPKNN